MRNDMTNNPFGDESVDEVHLPRAPLVHVVAQIRFTKLIALAYESGISPIHDALRGIYPVLREDKTTGVLITPDGVTTQSESETVWRLQSKSGDWQVSISSMFISLDTSAYVSRDDFLDRLGVVLTVFAEVANPPIAERVGIRYIDRIDDPDKLARLTEFVRPEILGGHAVPLDARVTMLHSVSESLYVSEDHQLLARWGVLPPGAVLDPVVPPSTNRSWILDLDASLEGRIEFDAPALTETVRVFADEVYRFFRWSVTNELIVDAGGSL